MKKDHPESPPPRCGEPHRSSEPPGSSEPHPKVTLRVSQDERHAIIDPLVRAAVALFRATPHDRWTVRQLAKAVGTSRPVLNRRFVEALKKPPLRVLREIRMNLAAELLTESDDGLAAIADAVGYDSEFALSRAFFRHFGTRPGAFRRTHHRETTAPTLLCAA